MVCVPKHIRGTAVLVQNLDLIAFCILIICKCKQISCALSVSDDNPGLSTEHAPKNGVGKFRRLIISVSIPVTAVLLLVYTDAVAVERRYHS